jgi:ABC-2 type transport system ATP-binding protein
MPESAISIEGLTKRFRSLRTYRDVLAAPWRSAGPAVVDDVSLEVPAGQVFGLLGQNGAGKTTLVRMLTTLLLPSSGRASVGGFDVVREAHAVRQRIGLVNGDERSFYWRLTGRDNLDFFAALQHMPSGLAARRIDELGDRLGIAEHLDRPFGQLSSGQRQKFAIARGLMSEPDVLFMDEPTRSLDPISAVTIRTFIQEHVIGQLGRTVVLATHSMPEAEALCGSVAFIQDGRIVAQGTVPQLRGAIGYTPRCDLVVRRAPVDLDARLAAVAGVRTVQVDEPVLVAGEQPTTAVRLAVDDDTTLNRVLAMLVVSGAEIIRCEAREASLEEIYVRTLGPSRVSAAGAAPVTVA